jgi:hypothetical protein
MKLIVQCITAIALTRYGMTAQGEPSAGTAGESRHTQAPQRESPASDAAGRYRAAMEALYRMAHIVCGRGWYAAGAVDLRDENGHQP